MKLISIVTIYKDLQKESYKKNQKSAKSNCSYSEIGSF